MSVGTFLGGIGISFYRSPVFALICIAYMPLIVITMSIFGQLSKAESFKKIEANRELGGFSEESLSALKLIVSFAQEKRAVELYELKARATRDVSQKANFCASLLYAVSRFVIFGFFVYCYFLATILI